jgi:hypothetical protein
MQGDALEHADGDDEGQVIDSEETVVDRLKAAIDTRWEQKENGSE